MHVLVAAHDLYPDPGSGGTGRYVHETARRLVARGHDVSVVVRRRGDVPRRETVAGIDVYRYDLSIAEEAAPAIVRQMPAARRRVRAHVETIAARDPLDIASFQGPVTALLVDRALPAVPRIATFHSPWPAEYALRTRTGAGASGIRRRLNQALRWSLERRLLRRSDGAVTLSRYMRDRLRSHYGDGIDATVIPGGVDADRFAPDAGRFPRMDEDGVAVLTVRRLAERMGHDTLLRAFAAVRRRVPDAHLYVAGDGPLRGRLEGRAADLGVSGATTFLGYVPDDALPSAYATADLFVLPTRELEGFGLATLEAMASGTPVVATPIGGTVEVLAGVRGRLPRGPLTADASAGALADGLVGWTNLDDDALDAAGRTCREYVRERYAWEVTVEGLLDTYRRHLDRQQPGRAPVPAGASDPGPDRGR